MSEASDNTAKVERRSDRELVVTRSFDAPAAVVFEAWSTPDLFRRWWLPPSFGMTLISCEMDVRTGGTYRLEIGHPASEQPMAFFGRYIEVVPGERIVWTNAESEDDAITTVTFEERDGRTLVTVSNLFPTSEAADAELESGGVTALPEQLAQLGKLLAGAS